MRILTTLPQDDLNDVQAAARAAEAAGYDGLLTMENRNEPFLALGVAAVSTTRIGLGTGIAIAFSRSAMAVANAGWDLQVASRGRFVLGLGPQVRAHNEKRFSVPWSAPAPRLREYVESLRAIWRTWEKREPLRYEGRHYRFTLMTPEFSPPPSNLPPVPIAIAAVGPAMLRLAGRVCDGVRLHGFCTRRYLEEVALPAVRAGLARSGRDRRHFQVWGGGFIATGADQDELRKAMDEVRYRVAFYGSTRSYRPVLSVHGWDELGNELHRMSLRGEWSQMAAKVPDEVVHAFAACAPYRDLPAAIEKRFGGLTDAIGLGFSKATPEGLVRELVADLRRIPSIFQGFATRWD